MAENHEYFRWTAELFDRKRIFDKPEALEGIRVLELTTLVLGPATADFLGEFGAEVIKVELPPAGDTLRYVTPRGTFWKNASLGFFPESHSKYHVAIDLHKEEGKALFKQLAARADILVENFRAGTLDRWGIGYRDLSALNPRLIYVANSGFGQWGPFALGRASYDAVAQTVSGMIGVTGFPGRPPIPCGIFIGDWIGALMSATAALVALHHRRRTGEGQLLDYAQSEGLIRSLDLGPGKVRGPLAHASEHRVGVRGFEPRLERREARVRGEVRRSHRLAEPAELGVGDRRDRDEAVPAAEDVGRPEGAVAVAGGSAVLPGEAGQHPRPVEALAEKHGFAAARAANAADRYADPHLRARGATWDYEDPLYGPMVEQGPAPKLSATPGRIRWAARPVGPSARRKRHETQAPWPPRHPRLRPPRRITGRLPSS